MVIITECEEQEECVDSYFAPALFLALFLFRALIPFLALFLFLRTT